MQESDSHVHRCVQQNNHSADVWSFFFPFNTQLALNAIKAKVMAWFSNDKMALALCHPVETCDSFIMHCPFISPPQCQCSSVSSILEANKWNSLVLLVITPSAVSALCPWSVMVLGTAPLKDCLLQQRHTLASLFQSSTLFYTWQPWQLQCNIQRKYCFHTLSLCPFYTKKKGLQKCSKNTHVLSKTFCLVLNPLPFAYVHDTPQIYT